MLEANLVNLETKQPCLVNRHSFADMASDAAIKKEISGCEAEETLLLIFRLSHQFPDLAAFL